MNLDKEFAELISKDKIFQEALKIVKNNSTGKVWLIGGYLFRNLANILYGTGEPDKGDIDFLTEKINRYITTLDWGVRMNSYGTPKFRKGETRLDLVPIDEVLSIKERSLKPTIENYLTGTPLTIQSLAYDIYSGEIIGDIGKKALTSKTIAVNSNLESAKNTARKKGMTMEQYVDKYAKSLGFKSANSTMH